VVLERDGDLEEIEADAVFLLTGYGADCALLDHAGVEIDPQTLGPVFDPATYETNVRGLYVAGALVGGVHSGKIFIENGRFHGEQVIRAIVEREKV
jgi:thioredoxin reductase (NADPH)